VNKQPFYHNMTVRFVGVPKDVRQATDSPEFAEKLGRFLKRNLGPVVGPVDLIVRDHGAEKLRAEAKQSKDLLTKRLMALSDERVAYEMEALFTGTADYSEEANSDDFRSKFEGFLKRNIGNSLLAGSLEFASPVDAEPGDAADLI
jgi:hypothetical protein